MFDEERARETKVTRVVDAKAFYDVHAIEMKSLQQREPLSTLLASNAGARVEEYLGFLWQIGPSNTV